MRYVDGPYDGLDTELPTPLVREGAHVPQPSAHFRENMAPPERFEIYTGPMDDYVIERRGDEWIAVYQS